MPKPKLSELFDAAAGGALSPYHQQSAVFSSAAYDMAQQTSGILRAIASVYRAYEQEQEMQPGSVTQAVAKED